MGIAASTTAKYDYDETVAEELGEAIMRIQDAAMVRLGINGFAYGDTAARTRVRMEVERIARREFPKDAKPGDIRRALYYADYWNAHTAVTAIGGMYGLTYDDWKDYSYEG